MNQNDLFSTPVIEDRKEFLSRGGFKPSHPFFYYELSFPVPVSQIPKTEGVEYSKRMDGSKEKVIRDYLKMVLKYKLTCIEYVQWVLDLKVKNYDPMTEDAELENFGLNFMYCHVAYSKALTESIGSDPERFSKLSIEELVEETKEFPITTEISDWFLRQTVFDLGGKHIMEWK